MSRPEPFAGIAFAVSALDRGGDARNDPAFIAAEEADPAGLTYVFGGDRAVLRPGDPPQPLFSPDAAAALGPIAARFYLGRAADGPRFASLIAAEDVDRLAAAGSHLAVDVRSLAGQALLADAHLGALGLTRSLAAWHGRHGFCPNCGAPTEVASGGWRRQCPHCGAEHYPRVDPVTIMLITDGARALLGRKPSFPAGRYSCLAGFVEPGETVEDAVRRETFEEAGVRVGAVTYLGAQPWPFPSSLMLGCRGEALGTAIRIDPTELEDARWFDPAELRAMLAGAHPDGFALPQPLAIAHHLIRRFMTEVG